MPITPCIAQRSRARTGSTSIRCDRGRFIRLPDLATLVRYNHNLRQGGGRRRTSMKTVRQLLAAKGGTVHSIGPRARVYEALRLMAEKEVGALVVLDNTGLAGIL